ncbi:MAG: hypothetical protein JNM58_01510 [Xanthomonadaceae bacterium]|nr:hypothetical protein [Xanthomonadaceae bacterium]
MPETPTVHAYRFFDARDPKLARSANESLIITNCAYGSVRIGQRDIEPDLALQLHAMLASRFGDRLAGREVKLTAFSLHINSAASLRAMVARMRMGPIASLMNNTQKVACSGDDTRGGYVLGEVPEGVSPIIAAVHVVVDGKPYRGRAISSPVVMAPESAAAVAAPAEAAPAEAVPTEAAPPSVEGGETAATPAIHVGYQRLIDVALAKLGDAIEADLATPAVDADASPGSPAPSPADTASAVSAEAVEPEPLPPESPTP